MIKCSFIRTHIRQNKIARRQVNLSEEQAPKPYCQSVCGERFEANTPTRQGTAEEEALPLELDRSAGAHPPCAHLRIIQVLRRALIFSLRSAIELGRTFHPQGVMRTLVIKALPPYIQA